MTVKELVEALGKYPERAEVRVAVAFDFNHNGPDGRNRVEGEVESEIHLVHANRNNVVVVFGDRS